MTHSSLLRVYWRVLGAVGSAGWSSGVVPAPPPPLRPTGRPAWWNGVSHVVTRPVCLDRLRAVGTARSSAKCASRRPGCGDAGRRPDCPRRSPRPIPPRPAPRRAWGRLGWAEPAGPADLSLPELLALTVEGALDACADLPKVRRRLQLLVDLGLGYLALGETTTALSGGEAQRLKLSNDLGRDQHGTVFVLDEPSIGLHPLDVRVLLGVLDRLVEAGATVLVIEHDLDMIANADWVIDMGPGGGADGGRVVATGAPPQVAAAESSMTGRYLATRGATLAS